MKLTKEQIDDMRTSLGHGAQPFTKEAIDTLCALAVRGLVAPEARESIPEELYDGMAVYVQLGVEKTQTIRPEMVSDVLDAVVRLIRKRQRGSQLPQSRSSE